MGFMFYLNIPRITKKKSTIKEKVRHMWNLKILLGVSEDNIATNAQLVTKFKHFPSFYNE